MQSHGRLSGVCWAVLRAAEFATTLSSELGQGCMQAEGSGWQLLQQLA